MNENESVKEFWQNFCRENQNVNSDEPYQVWFFSNNQESAKELAELVISGKKQATASLVHVNKLKPEFAPYDNGYSVVTDFCGKPLCIIQTTEIRHIPFDEVDAQFAFDEGEGDQTLEYWRKCHQDYFTKEGKEYGIKFDEKTLICCERFKLLFPQ